MINLTQITTDANYPAGLGGRGQRQWDADEHNYQSAPLYIHFKEPQKEIWYRWYMRFEQGYARLAGTRYHKIWYWRTDGGATSINVIPEPYGDNQWVAAIQGGYNYANSGDQLKAQNFGWTSLHGGEASDGSWHAYEIHMKMDTGAYTGEGQLWIDGILRAENLAMNYSNDNPQVQTGWMMTPFNNNHSQNVNGREMYVDMDDIVFYNTTPPNIDASGNSFIGPISNDAIAPSFPIDLIVQ